MRYPTMDDCRLLLFPYIRSRLISVEPAPYYEGEASGLRRLEGILGLMARDEYEGAVAKATYLFCSIVDGHPFSNGNKRLGVTILLFFLLSNGYKVNAPNMRVMRQELQRIFPNLHWEDIDAFHHPHEYFFYHLSLIIADRKQKGQISFTQERAAVEELLRVVIVDPKR